MSLHKGNALKGTYKDFLINSLRRAIASIPAERRPFLAEEIRAKANLIGCKDPEVLRSVLEELGV